MYFSSIIKHLRQNKLSKGRKGKVTNISIRLLPRGNPFLVRNKILHTRFLCEGYTIVQNFSIKHDPGLPWYQFGKRTALISPGTSNAIITSRQLSKKEWAAKNTTKMTHTIDITSSLHSQPHWISLKHWQNVKSSEMVFLYRHELQQESATTSKSIQACNRSDTTISVVMCQWSS